MSLYMQYKYTLTHRHTKSKLCVGNAEYGKTDSTILTVTDVLHQSTVSMKPERLENMYNFQSFTQCFVLAIHRVGRKEALGAKTRKLVCAIQQLVLCQVHFTAQWSEPKQHFASVIHDISMIKITDLHRSTTSTYIFVSFPFYGLLQIITMGDRAFKVSIYPIYKQKKKKKKRKRGRARELRR